MTQKAIFSNLNVLIALNHLLDFTMHMSQDIPIWNSKTPVYLTSLSKLMIALPTHVPKPKTWTFFLFLLITKPWQCYLLNIFILHLLFYICTNFTQYQPFISRNCIIKMVLFLSNLYFAYKIWMCHMIFFHKPLFSFHYFLDKTLTPWHCLKDPA